MRSKLLIPLVFALAILPGWKLAGGQSQSSANSRSPHGSLSIPCQNCHTLSGWKPIRAVPEFDHNTTKYPLRGMHEGVSCNQCHTKMVFSNVGKQCADCHADIHKRQMGANCEQCHNVKGWHVAVQQINQHLNRFPLIGAHATLDCDSCHKSAAVGQFQGLSTACVSCHQQDFINTKSIGIDHVVLKLSTACETCHSMDNWMGAKFDHLAVTGFALTGAHAALDCAACHAGGKFNTASATCVGCHLADFNKTNNPPHAQANFPTTCQTCHNTTAWNPATFDHNTFTKFPLTGGHVTVACNLCHINGQFVGTPTDCASCHMKDFSGTTNPNHVTSGFPTTCQQCHTTATWTTASFDHNSTGFSLTGAHSALQCSQCHNTTFSPSGAYSLTSTTCITCHLKDFQGTTAPNHVTANLPQACQQCHNTTSWTGATFDHSTTGFTLTGAHTALTCDQCHNTTFSPSGAYSLTSTACITCHTKDFQGTTSPPHVSSNISQSCEQCHTTTNWGGANFNHATTGFTLTGAHTTLTCDQCHNTTFSPSGAYSLTSAACVTCHMKDFQGTTNPNHATAGISQSCEQCHSTTNWGNGTFDHSTTGFTLTGAHIALQCAQCHNTTFSPSGAYNLTSTTCITCHQTDYNGTTNPSHVQANFPQGCQQCHSTTNWTGATFDHTTTGFTLTGAHTALTCAQCHNTTFSPSGAYNFTSAACVTCHMTDYNGTTAPPHASAGIAQTCQNCHSTTNWGNGSFDHSTTGFVLTGFHTTMACTGCHNTTLSPSGAYNLTSANTTCISCHMTDFQGTTNPSHVQSNFPQTCQQCHSTTNWGGATFDHTTTGFALTGFHTTMACTGCHNTTLSPSGAYNLTSGTCVNCHLTDFQGTTNPSHVQANFPQTCQTCHTTTNWTGATFNHTTTGFALTGFHTTMACTGCHNTTLSPAGAYSLTSGTCVNCHLADFNGTTNPSHVASGFPQTCDQCHSTTNWTGATFNHTSTGFTLVGFHATMACSGCHNTTISPAGAYSLTSANTTCISCHQTDYNNTNAPPHATSGFPTTCDTCHSTTDWTGATFNHNNTTFPLTGFHATAAVTCVMCHVNSNYTTLPTACVGCHQTDYNNTTNPAHASAGFPTTCATCHTTTAWTGATFNHTYFPMTHGNANSVCATCHTNPSDYSVFQCTGCHGNNNAANFNHPNVGGYVYNSVNCYQCHKSGGGG